MVHIQRIEILPPLLTSLMIVGRGRNMGRSGDEVEDRVYRKSKQPLSEWRHWTDGSSLLLSQIRERINGTMDNMLKGDGSLTYS